MMEGENNKESDRKGNFVIRWEEGVQGKGKYDDARAGGERNESATTRDRRATHARDVRLHQGRMQE